MPMSSLLHAFGALALETAEPPRHLLLARDAADALGQHVAVDLPRLLPGVERVDLVLAGAHFDPAELLRPGWPVHAALADLARRAPGTQRGRVIALGAHAAAMPLPALQPDAALQGGPLRVLPFVLLGEAADIAELGRAMEERLLETGMAGAATALYAQSAFGAKLEHARYLSLHDLLAMTAMQYEHAGLAALWPLIEAALLAPESEEWLDAPPEPLLRYAGGEVAMEAEPADAARALRLRRGQLRAVLQAHGIPVRIGDLSAAGGEASSRTLE
jgi:hypothetical protein